MTTLRLIQTCAACPQLFEAYLGEREVGYIRERHGRFRAYVGDEQVYEAEENRRVDWKVERDRHLARASAAILHKLGEPIPKCVYDVYVLEKEMLLDDGYPCAGAFDPKEET